MPSGSSQWRRCSGRFTGPENGRINADLHFTKHVLTQREWPTIPLTTATYIERAATHLNRPDLFGFYNHQSAAIVKYDLENNELAVANDVDGHIRTLFRPHRGAAYVIDQLERGEWVPYAAAQCAAYWMSADCEDPVAYSMSSILQELIGELPVLEAAAQCDAKEWMDGGRVDLSNVVLLTATVMRLTAMMQHAFASAGTQDEEEVTRQIEAAAAEWQGVLDGFMELLGPALIESTFAAVEATLSEMDASMNLDIQNDDTDAEDLRIRRDEVEFLLAFVAGCSAENIDLIDRYLVLRTRVEMMDRRLRRSRVPAGPAGSKWHPLQHAWWRASQEVTPKA